MGPDLEVRSVVGNHVTVEKERLSSRRSLQTENTFEPVVGRARRPYIGWEDSF